MAQRDPGNVPAATRGLTEEAEIDLEAGEEHQIGEAEQAEECQPFVVLCDDAEQRFAEDDPDQDFTNHRREQSAGKSPGDERHQHRQHADQEQRSEIQCFLHCSLPIPTSHPMDTD